MAILVKRMYTTLGDIVALAVIASQSGNVDLGSICVQVREK